MDNKFFSANFLTILFLIIAVTLLIIIYVSRIIKLKKKKDFSKDFKESEEYGKYLSKNLTQISFIFALIIAAFFFVAVLIIAKLK